MSLPATRGQGHCGALGVVTVSSGCWLTTQHCCGSPLRPDRCPRLGTGLRLRPGPAWPSVLSPATWAAQCPPARALRGAGTSVSVSGSCLPPQAVTCWIGGLQRCPVSVPPACHHFAGGGAVGRAAGFPLHRQRLSQGPPHTVHLPRGGLRREAPSELRSAPHWWAVPRPVVLTYCVLIVLGQ